MTGKDDAQVPIVSVLMMTYNHAPFIGEAIESVLNQQTQYPFELIICDDASMDGAQEIAREYAKRDPRIVLSLQAKNTRFAKNFVDGCKRVRGKYLAFCEGDDYWTNPQKLEKQVGYLEAHPDFAVSAHRVQMLNMNDPQPGDAEQFIYKDCSADEARVKQGIFYADEAIANYYFQTGSLVLRWRFKDGFPDWFRKRMMFDHFFFMLHAVEGKIKYFDEAMSVWRRHGGGYTWLQTQDKGLFFQKEGNDWIQMYSFMDNFFSKRFTLQIEERINLALRSMAQNCLETGNMDNLRWLVSVYEKEFKNALKNRVLVDAFRMIKPQNLEFSPPWSSVPQGDQSSAELSSDNKEKTAPQEHLMGSAALAIDEIPPCTDSVWARWTNGREAGEYFNLRSALCAWLWHNGLTTVWVPAYSPPSLVKMLHKCQFDYRLYTTSETLRQGSEFFSQIQPGDAVLAIEYLGMPLSGEFCEAMAAHPDVHWLIDRRQSLSATEYPGANAYFYCPPNLFNVPDGAVTVKAAGAGGELVTYGTPRAPGEENFFLPDLEHPQATATNANRLERLKRREKHELSQMPMSRITKLLLERIPYESAVEQRKANWAYLFSELGDFCLWDLPKPDFAPYAFPFLCPTNITCEIVQTLLARKNIASRRMWYPLSVPKRLFPVEEMLSQRLLLLPVDSRLNSDAMSVIAGAVKRILACDTVCGLKTLTF